MSVLFSENVGALLVYTSTAPAVKVTSAGVLAVINSTAQYERVAQAGIFIVYDTPAVLTAEAGLVLVLDMPVVETSHVGVIAVYTENVSIPRNAWGFTFDGHPFYALTIEDQGTFLYDVASEQWCEWRTQGFAGWNMRAGTHWRDIIVGGSANSPDVWKIDPAATEDEGFRVIERIVTGGIPTSGRVTLRTGMFVLSALRQDDFNDDNTPTVKLSVSDDGGVTFKALRTIELDEDTDIQDLSWRSLGVIRAPGRVFKIEDVGGLVTIKDAIQTLKDEER